MEKAMYSGRFEKIGFYISFIPFIMLYYVSIKSYIDGFSFLFHRSSGFDAVKGTFVMHLLFFSVIFVGCFIYQLYYGMKTRHRKKGYILTTIIHAVLVGMFFIYSLF